MEYVDNESRNDNKVFYVYIIFIISYFLHIPARIPILGAIRFDLLLVITIFLLLFLYHKNVKRSNRSSTEYLINILCIYVILAVPFAEWPGTVLRSGLPNFIKAVIFFYFTVIIMNTEKKLKIMIFIFLACQLFRVLEPLYLHITEGYWGDSTYMGEGYFMDRLTGSPYDVINPNGLAFIIVSIVPFLHFYLLNKKIKYKLLYVVMLTPLIYALILTASRTGLLALFIIGLGIFIKSKNKILLTSIVVIGAILIIPNLSPLQRDRYLSITRDDVRGSQSVQLRYTGIREDLKLALNRPVFGHGLGTSLEVNVHGRNVDLVAHNLYVELMQEIGIIGTLIYILFIFTIIKNFIYVRKKIKHSNFENKFIETSVDAMQVWLLMNMLFSIASYGLSSYEWYLFAGFSVVLLRITNEMQTKAVLDK